MHMHMHVGDAVLRGEAPATVTPTMAAAAQSPHQQPLPDVGGPCLSPKPELQHARRLQQQCCRAAEPVWPLSEAHFQPHTGGLHELAVHTPVGRHQQGVPWAQVNQQPLDLAAGQAAQTDTQAAQAGRQAAQPTVGANAGCVHP